MTKTKLAHIHTFQLVLGDWSGDGHSQTAQFTVESNMSVEDVREAYFTAAKNPRLVDFDPANICREYGIGTISLAERDKFKRASGIDLCPAYDSKFEADDAIRVNARPYAEFCLWFCMQGDPELRLKLAPALNMLHFYGYDKKQRHLPGFGYGLFGDD